MPLSDDLEMLSPVLLPNHDPTNPNHATRKSWVQAQDAATLASAQAYTDAETSRAEAAEALLAPLANPTFTGTPQAPTPTSGNNSAQLATTAFVQATVGSAIAGIDWKRPVFAAIATDPANLAAVSLPLGGADGADQVGQRVGIFSSSVKAGLYTIASISGGGGGSVALAAGGTVYHAEPIPDLKAPAFTAVAPGSPAPAAGSYTLDMHLSYDGNGTFTYDLFVSGGPNSWSKTAAGSGTFGGLAVGITTVTATFPDASQVVLTLGDGWNGTGSTTVGTDIDTGSGSASAQISVDSGAQTASLVRASDMDEAAEFDTMVMVPVQYGTLGGRWYYLSATSDTPFVVGTSIATWTQFITGAELSASMGVQLVGNDIRADLLSTGGLGLDGDSLKIRLPADSGLATDATGLFVPPMGIKPEMKATMTAKIGDGVNTTYVINHNLGVENVVAVLKRRSDNKVMGIFPYLTDADNLTLVFSDPPTQDQYEIFIEPVSARIA
ncbi:hypothetical protein J7643_03805 [bacterium]|nr:hypothetical protein [bacterium]